MDKDKLYLKRYFLTFFLIISSGLFTELWASHIRAAEITVERLGTRRYRFTLTGIRDSQDGLVDFGLGTFRFGDGIGFITNLRNDPRDEAGNPVAVTSQIEELGNGIELNVFVMEYTYASIQPVVLVSYEEDFRNAGILNIENSGMTPFYGETQFSIDPAVGPNNSPRMSVLPIDRGDSL